MSGIGNLVAHLAVDYAAWNKGLKGAKGSLGGFVKGIKGPLAAAGAALGGLWTAKAAISAQQEQLKSEKKLAAVLKATGHAAGLSAGEIKDFASELQGVTNFGDEATISNAAVLATFKEIKGDTFKSAIVAAQDMSSVLGSDVKASIIQVGKALNDPAKGLAALADSGVSFTEQQKKQVKQLQESGDIAGAQQVILQELQGEFGGASKAMVSPFKQLSNTIGDVGEMFGSVLLPPLNTLAGLFKDKLNIFIEQFGGYFKAAGEIAGIALQSIGPIWSGALDMIMTAGKSVLEFFNVEGKTTFAGFAESVVTFLAMAEFAFTNWREVGSMAVKMVWLEIVSFWEELKHTFSEKIPAVLNWFADNWWEVMYTAVDYAMTIFINLGKNIREMWSSVLDFISGNGFNPDFTPLTEGAYNAIASMPNIPERVMTEYEAELSGQIKDMKATLGEGMQAVVNERLEAIKPAITALKEAGKPDTKTDDAPVIAEEKPVTQKEEQTKFAGVNKAGTAQAFSTILAATQNNPQVMELKNNTAAVKKGSADIVKAVKQNKSGASLQVQGAVP